MSNVGQYRSSDSRFNNKYVIRIRGSLSREEISLMVLAIFNQSVFTVLLHRQVQIHGQRRNLANVRNWKFSLTNVKAEERKTTE